MNMPASTTPDSPQSVPTSERVDEIRSKFGSPRLALEPLPHGSSTDEIVSNPRIAVVDDEPINVQVVCEHLRMAGYQQFFTTSDSTKALDLIRAERPDILLLDIMMPQVSGLDILNELRESEELFDLPVIILTAATDRKMKLKALESGAAEFLTKPVDSVELTLRLKNVLRMKAHFDRLKSYAWELEHEVAAIADVFDTLTGKRPSKRALPTEERLAVIRGNRGVAFDPAVVDAFFDRIDEVLQVCREFQE